MFACVFVSVCLCVCVSVSCWPSGRPPPLGMSLSCGLLTERLLPTLSVPSREHVLCQGNKSGRKALAPLSQQRCMKKMKQGHCPNETSTASLCLQMLQTFAQISRHSKSLRWVLLPARFLDTKRSALVVLLVLFTSSSPSASPCPPCTLTPVAVRLERLVGDIFETSPPVSQAGGTKTHGRSFPRNGLPTSTSAKV